MKRRFLLWLLLGSMGFVSVVQAQLDAEPLPGDPRLVLFSYDANNSYRVYTRPMASTHIELASEERVRLLALGDTAGWITAARDNHVFIKPRYPNVSTSGTLITNRRTYQFVFRSTQDGGRWYQRVTFQIPEDLAIDAAEADRAKLLGSDIARPPSVGEFDGSPGKGTFQGRSVLAVTPDQLNFNYEIEGSADFRPLSVFDDGTSTYVQLRSGTQDIPAVFRLVNGPRDIELLEYTLKGSSLVIPRVLGAALLKLGQDEVRFFNRKRLTRSWLGGYRYGEGSQP
jgi:type IV secretion system protein VirB9